MAGHLIISWAPFFQHHWPGRGREVTSFLDDSAKRTSVIDVHCKYGTKGDE